MVYSDRSTFVVGSIEHEEDRSPDLRSAHENARPSLADEEARVWEIRRVGAAVMKVSILMVYLACFDENLPNEFGRQTISW